MYTIWQPILFLFCLRPYFKQTLFCHLLFHMEVLLLPIHTYNTELLFQFSLVVFAKKNFGRVIQHSINSILKVL